MERKKREMFFIGIGSGLILGSLLGILLAPFSGRELRMKLDDFKDDFKDRAQRFKEPEKYSRIKV
jgi:gas vesicle protein